MATTEVRLGDMLCIDWDEREQKLVFEREGEGAVLPVMVQSASPRTPGRAGLGGKPALKCLRLCRPRSAGAPIALPPSAPVLAPANRRKNES